MKIDFFPKQIQALETVLSNKYGFILYGGAIRGGKTVWGLTTLLLLCEIFPRSRWCIIREDIERLRTTTIPSFKKLESRGKLKESPYEYTHHNGSVILFKSENFAKDKELDWMKGLEVNGFLFEEINECQKQTLEKSFERAGSWIIPNSAKQPYPIVLATCNPSNGWVKDLVYTPWKEKSLKQTWHYIQSRIYDNIPLLEEQPNYLPSLKANMSRYEYEVYVEGNWDVQLKTGGEFLHNFELSKHVKPTLFNPDEIVHISMDSNVYPYIALTFWQLTKVDNKWHIKLIDELPCTEPLNTASSAGQQVGLWLQKNNYAQKQVYVYGDTSTKSRNNIDDLKRTFFDIVVENIKKSGYGVVDKMTGKSNSVSAIGDYLNFLLSENCNYAEIIIGEKCKNTINDFIEIKKDKDGTMLKIKKTDPKTNVSYEPFGHLLDTFKDFIFQSFNKEFNEYINKPKFKGYKATTFKVR